MSFSDNIGFLHNPFSHDKAREHHEFLESQSDEKPRGAPLSHEIIAGAAAFKVIQGYEKHREEQGREVKHAKLKETLAGLAAAEALNIAEKHHQNLEHGERNKLAVKAAQQTTHLADEVDQRPPGRAREHDVVYESKTVRNY